MKSNFIKIVFLLILGIFFIYPRVSHAANCTENDIKRITETAKKNIEASFKILTQYADTFNTAAEDYIKNCKTPAEKPDSIEAISTDAAAVAQANGVNYKDEKIWKYTGYNWQQEVPPAEKQGCDNLLKKAQNARDYLIKKKIDTEAAINRARIIKDRDSCVCSAQDMESTSVCYKTAADEIAKDASSCKTFSQYQMEFGGKCMLCPIFRVILNTIASVSSVAWNAVSEPLAKVVGTIFLVLLALEVLKAVAAPAGSKIGSLAKGVLVLSAKVAFTVLLLSNAHYIYGYFLSPVLEGGLEMGVAIANATSSGGHCAEVSEGHTGISSDTFTPKLFNTVLSTVDCFGKSAAMMPAVGRGLTCNAWKDTNYGVPNLTMWFSGAIMYVLGVMIWLAISFYMIDCTVQIGMLSGLVPLLIACWPFKLTESYTFKGCKMLMNSFFTYAMVGIVLLIGMTITTFAIGGGDMAQLQLAIDNSDIDTLRELCDFGALQILILISCAIFSMKLIGQTGNLADQFSKGASSDIGTKLGGAAASAVTNAAVSSAKSGGKIVGTLGKLASDELGITAGLNKTGDKITGAWRKGVGKAGRLVGLGKFQNKQTGSGMGGEETKPEDKENKKPEDKENQGGRGNNTNSQNDIPNPNDGDNTNPNTPSGGDNQNPQIVRNADGSSTQSTFDAEGNESWKSFNADGSLKAEGLKNVDGSGMAKMYNEDGQLGQENSWDANGKEQQKFYKEGEHTGTFTKAKDDQGNEHWRIQDAEGKMTSSGVRNADGTSSQLDYNKDGKVTNETHQTQGSTIFKNHKYDENGNLEQKEGGLFGKNKK